MAKRRLKKAPKAADLTDAAERLRKALAKRTKGELIDVLVEFAREDHKLLRRLDVRFEPEAPPKELVAATRRAIADATDFDEREINYNFDYDYEAYHEVKRNLSRLVAPGTARSLSPPRPPTNTGRRLSLSPAPAELPQSRPPVARKMPFARLPEGHSKSSPPLSKSKRAARISCFFAPTRCTRWPMRFSVVFPFRSSTSPTQRDRLSRVDH